MVNKRHIKLLKKAIEENYIFFLVEKQETAKSNLISIMESYPEVSGLILAKVKSRLEKVISFMENEYILFCSENNRLPNETGEEKELQNQYKSYRTSFPVLVHSYDQRIEEILLKKEREDFQKKFEEKIIPFIEEHDRFPKISSEDPYEKEIASRFGVERWKFSDIVDSYLKKTYRYSYKVDTKEGFIEFMEEAFTRWVREYGYAPRQRSKYYKVSEAESSLDRQYRRGKHNFPNIVNRYYWKLIEEYPDLNIIINLMIYMTYCFKYGTTVPDPKINKKIYNWHRYELSKMNEDLLAFKQVWSASEFGNQDAKQILDCIKKDYLELDSLLFFVLYLQLIFLCMYYG